MAVLLGWLHFLEEFERKINTVEINDARSHSVVALKRKYPVSVALPLGVCSVFIICQFIHFRGGHQA